MSNNTSNTPIKVLRYDVNIDMGENSVEHEYLDYDSVDALWEDIDEEFGEEDVNCERIRDQYGDDDILVNGDVWFVRIVIQD